MRHGVYSRDASCLKRLFSSSVAVSRALYSTIFILCAFYGAPAQCLEGPGVIWKSDQPVVRIGDLAAYTAPVLWFSPDEPDLYDAGGLIQLPEPFGDDTPSDRPVVYYKVRNIYAHNDKEEVIRPGGASMEDRIIDLEDVGAVDLEFYFYYRKEQGLGGHPHDLESVAFQLQVIHNPFCPEASYLIQVRKVIARAHGLAWFENALKVDYATVFPLSILIEEGKHANCTDKNADGIYTPGYDVSEKVNDAWGVRDIISSGKLFSGGYQAWMSKARTSRSKLLPPLPTDSPHFEGHLSRNSDNGIQQTYQLRAFPDLVDRVQDRKLKKMIKSKRPADWPRTINVSGDGSILQWSKENKPHKAVGISYRKDEMATLAFSVPLLIFKNVQAPLTGGWFYHKLYGGSDQNINPAMTRSFGHQIVHSNSASRWLDSYIGMGYELHDINLNPELSHTEAYFVSEIGLKIRVNITNSPFRFLRLLGTEYWGLRLGWKNVGFNPFMSSGFVLEFGAGVF